MTIFPCGLVFTDLTWSEQYFCIFLSLQEVMNKLGRNFTKEVAIQKGFKVKYGWKRGTKGKN